MVRRVLGIIVLTVPRFVWVGLAWALALLWFDVFRIRRSVAVANVLRAFPEFDHNKANRIARASIYHLAMNLVEFVYMPVFEARHLSRFFVMHGYHHLETARSNGRGALLLGLHLGNGDFSIAALSRSGMPVHLISKEFKARWLNRLWFGMRGRHGTRFIPVEKSSFDILRALRNNELVIFVLDQFMGPPSGVPTKFFGHPTGTAAGLAVFADRTRSPVIPCFTYRDTSGISHMVFEAPLPFVEGTTKEDTVARMTQIYTDEVERIVRLHPEQWMWIHRRWKNFA
jgi:KDO2-lipid IV(A) lauroyltransferase